LDNTIDKPIYYVSRLMNNDEKKKHYTTKKETLAIIYVVKKFRHYLFSNNFVFYVDHQTLLYLVN
jgi:hypothetical protein